MEIELGGLMRRFESCPQPDSAYLRQEGSRIERTQGRPDGSRQYPDDGSDTRKLYVEQRELSDAGWCQSLRVDTRLANKLRAWYLRAVAKGALENGKADAPLSETTATAARTAAAATVSLKTAAAARSAVAKPNRSRAPRRSHQYFARRRDDLTNG
jgi:hypothetical protein